MKRPKQKTKNLREAWVMAEFEQLNSLHQYWRFLIGILFLLFKPSTDSALLLTWPSGSPTIPETSAEGVTLSSCPAASDQKWSGKLFTMISESNVRLLLCIILTLSKVLPLLK